MPIRLLQSSNRLGNACRKICHHSARLGLSWLSGSKRIVPASSATLPVASPLFVIMLVGTVVIVGALTFFPVLVLGPILEHLLLAAGRTF